MFVENYMAKKKELNRTCAQRGRIVEERAGGKDDGKEKEGETKNKNVR